MGLFHPYPLPKRSTPSAHSSHPSIRHSSHAHLPCTPPIHTSNPHLSFTPSMHISYSHFVCALLIHTSNAHLSFTPVIGTLSTSEPRYVRCIKPNHVQAVAAFEEQLVVNQVPSPYQPVPLRTSPYLSVPALTSPYQSLLIRLTTNYYLPFVTHHSPLTTHYLLFIMCYSPPTTHHSLLTTQ